MLKSLLTGDAQNSPLTAGGPAKHDCAIYHLAFDLGTWLELERAPGGVGERDLPTHVDGQ